MPAIPTNVVQLSTTAMTGPSCTGHSACDSRPGPIQVTGLDPSEIGKDQVAPPDERREGRRRVTLDLRPNTFEALCAVAERDVCSLSHVVEQLLCTHVVGDAVNAQ